MRSIQAAVDSVVGFRPTWRAPNGSKTASYFRRLRYSDQIDFPNGGAGDDWLIFTTSEDKVTGKAESSS